MTQASNITKDESNHKSEAIRFTLEGEDYLHFSELSARLIFGKNSTDRKNKESTAKLGIALLYHAVANATNAGQPFVKADLSVLLPAMIPVAALEAEAPEQVDYKSLYLALGDAVKAYKEAPSDEALEQIFEAAVTPNDVNHAE